jgi:hypothetical protein
MVAASQEMRQGQRGAVDFKLLPWLIANLFSFSNFSETMS